MITEKFLQTIRKYSMISPGDKVLVGLSGGVDSTALLLILGSLSKELGITIIAAHLNHRIRGKESDADEAFAKKLSGKLGIRFVSGSFDVPAYARSNKLNLEDAARRIRYEFFERTAAKEGAGKIAVAHTADDNIETFLMRLIRGAGLKGLEGIPPVRGKVIRPLIELTRKELEQYLKARKIKARQDSSNFNRKYLRNSVRHELIPMLEGYNKSIKQGLLRTMKAINIDYDLLEEMAHKMYKTIRTIDEEGRLMLSVKPLLSLHPALRAGVVRSAIEEIKKDLMDVTFVNVDDVLRLLSKKSSGVDIPGAYVQVNRGKLVFAPLRPAAKEAKSFLYRLEVPGEVMIPESGLAISSDMVDPADAKDLRKKDPYRAFLDSDKINGRLIVRSRKKGDIFSPLGLKGSKKLQDIFVDEKVDAEERDSIPVIEDVNKIVWICGFRISDKVKIDRGTKKVIELSARKI